MAGSNTQATSFAQPRFRPIMAFTPHEPLGLKMNKSSSDVAKTSPSYKTLEPKKSILPANNPF